MLKQLQLADDPAIDKTLCRGVCCCGKLLALGVHQDKTRGVPELVAKVAIAFTTFQIKIDVAPKACIGSHGKAQCIGAKGWDAIRKLFARGFFNGARLLGVHQTIGAFAHQGFKIDAINQIHRVKRVALGFAHFLAFGVAN